MYEIVYINVGGKFQVAEINCYQLKMIGIIATIKKLWTKMCL